MKLYIILFIIFVITKITNCDEWELDRKRNTMEQVTARGYPIIEFQITTEDNYIITIYRIPGKKGESISEALSKRRPPIILQHGFLCSSDNIVDGGNNSFAYLFADLGYDLWIPNTRGNRQNFKYI